MNLSKGVMVSLAIILCMTFTLAEEINLRINTQLSSVDIQGRFKFETDSSSLNGIDPNDLRLSIDYSNYSALYSVVSSSNLIVDSRLSESLSDTDLVFAVDSTQTGNVTFSWSYSNSEYPIRFYDFGSDSSREVPVISFLMSSRSSYTFEFSGNLRYFRLESYYVAPTSVTEEEQETMGPEGGSGCVDTTWSDVYSGQCNYGEKVVSQISNCENSREILRDCCTSAILYGTWGFCSIDNTRTRTIESRDESCVSTYTTETGSCTYGCTEDWTCQFGSCQNGIKLAINCVDKNSCGTFDKKPSNLLCTKDSQISTGTGGGGETSFLNVKPNCDIDLKCSDWDPCKVQNGLEDLKNRQISNDGVKTRKCIDQNGCLNAPYIEQEKCSLKMFITPNREEFCGQEYLTLYKEGTDYLLARIKDERNTSKRAISMQFALGGKLAETSCDSKAISEYNYSIFEKAMSFTDIRNLWRVFE